MIASVSVKSQQNQASVQIAPKTNNVGIYMNNPFSLLLTMKFTNVEDNTEYMFYGGVDFPAGGMNIYVGAIPAGTYTVEVGDFGHSPAPKLVKTNCEYGYKQGEPIYWYNHVIGDGCGEYFSVWKMYH
jgi:hypothetical protein